MFTHFRLSEKTVAAIETADFVPFATMLPDPLVPLNSRSQITIVLWISPHEFYVHLKSHELKFDEMMEQLQLFYNGRPFTKHQPKKGNVIVVNDRNENVFKRALIVDYNAQLNKYRIKSLDYGSTSICEIKDIHDVEKTFVQLPPLAIRCSLPNIISNYSHAEILERIDAYINPDGIKIQCHFMQMVDNITFVEVEMVGSNPANLKERLLADSIISLLPMGEFKFLLIHQKYFMKY